MQRAPDVLIPGGNSNIATIGITDDGRMSLLGWIGTVNSMYTSITP
jgi:hypothetical protein